jgi:hypothetical protein
MSRQNTAHVAKTLKASADLSAALKRYTFVKISGASTVTTAGAGDTPVGIQQNVPGDGKGCVFALLGAGGGSRLRIGAAVAAGAKLKSDASGRGVTAAAANEYWAIAVGAASNADEEVEVILQTGHVPA